MSTGLLTYLRDLKHNSGKGIETIESNLLGPNHVNSCFSVKFPEFLRTPFLQNTCSGCFFMYHFSLITFFYIIFIFHFVSTTEFRSFQILLSDTKISKNPKPQ